MCIYMITALLCSCAVRHFLMRWEQVERLERCSVCTTVCMCVSRVGAGSCEPQVHGRGCSSAHWFHSQRPPCNISRKVFLYGASSKRFWRNFWGHEYVDELPAGGRESFTAPTRAFYIRQGSVGWREGKSQREGRKGSEERQTEGTKVNGRLFSHEVLFPFSTGRLSLSPTSTLLSKYPAQDLIYLRYMLLLTYITPRLPVE